MRKRFIQKLYQLTAVDVEILQCVQAYKFITCDQLIRLRYSKGTKTTVQTKLKCLYENKYLDRRALPDVTPGNPEYIYALSTKAITLLQSQGCTGFSRFRPDEFRQFAFPHLQHALAVSDFLIAARLVQREVVSITLAETRHDLDLKKSPVRVTVERRLPGGGKTPEKITIISDGFLDFRKIVPGGDKQRRRCIVLELDRGTETHSIEWKKKIRGYVAYAMSKEYQKLFGTDLCVVAYATTAGEKRRKQMIEWCEQELREQRLEHEANLYRFTALPDGEYDPKEIFCSEMWYKPFEDEPVSLLWNV